MYVLDGICMCMCWMECACVGENVHVLVGMCMCW